MMAHWSIRKKLLLCIALLLVTVSLLAVGGFSGAYGYRSLVRSVSQRAKEMNLAFELLEQVDAMQASLFVERGWLFSHADVLKPAARDEFRDALLVYEERLKDYESQMHRGGHTGHLTGDSRQEQAALDRIHEILERLRYRSKDEDWWLNDCHPEEMRRELQTLSQLSFELPAPLLGRMYELASHSRLEYRTWIVLVWVNFILALGLLAVLVRLVFVWILQPLRVLFAGSRRVAAGDFRHHIRLATHDEMSELAGAINCMTDRFCEIRDGLDRQVRERTREVVRSEQLASVGFLAAGVAHEINNPLASIAMCAESLEDRLHDIIAQDDRLPDEEHNEEITVLRHYLRMIQDEAFRCKEITDGLLDFSRLVDVERQSTDLTELVQGVIDMVGHLGKYKEKNICFEHPPALHVCINPQEWKQVVLNLITNGLDSLNPGGTVTVTLEARDGVAELRVRDDGCGMTDEVQRHLFEPFFTRRRDGQGTGLGMSITYRIVSDHGGDIHVYSAGPGSGSEITISLPLSQGHAPKGVHHRQQAA